MLDFRKELKEKRIHNPDIGLDENYYLFLVHPEYDGFYVKTETNIF